MAATNLPDILDPALTRPGRFDRHVSFFYLYLLDLVNCVLLILEETEDGIIQGFWVI